MYYLIAEEDVGKQDGIVRELVDFSWDSELIRVKSHPKGMIVDFGAPLGPTLLQLQNRIGTSVKPIRTTTDGWQIVHRNTTAEN